MLINFIGVSLPDLGKGGLISESFSFAQDSNLAHFLEDWSQSEKLMKLHKKCINRCRGDDEILVQSLP